MSCSIFFSSSSEDEEVPREKEAESDSKKAVVLVEKTDPCSGGPPKSDGGVGAAFLDGRHHPCAVSRSVLNFLLDANEKARCRHKELFASFHHEHIFDFFTRK